MNQQTPSFRITDRVRWSDVDAAGIVCYGSYLRFFEVAETELFRKLGLTMSMLHEEHGLWLVRRRVECDFHRPIVLDDELEVSASVPHVGRTSLELPFVIRRAGEEDVAVEGRYVLVAIDQESFRPAPLPETVRRALAVEATPQPAAAPEDRGR